MTNPGRGDPEGQRCDELVEMLTAYLDDALPEVDKRRIEAHLEECEGCRAALAQWRAVAGLASELSAEDVASLDPYVRDRLLSTLTEPRRH